MRVPRTIVVALLAVGGAILVVRSAFVAAYLENEPARAAAVWPGHPRVILRSGLDRIGAAAAAGQAVTPAMIEPLLAAARAAPLAPEPFLVRGVQRRVAGDEAGAGKAFAEARRRDPRSVPARFFLADHFLRSNEIGKGLAEIAAITRLVPGSGARLAPVLASYAQTPEAEAQVRAMLRSHPALEPPLLQHLAADARNADLILALASDNRATEGRRPGWQGRLVNSLVATGQYSRAHALWSRLMGLPAPAPERPLLFDARFERKNALAPFGWTLVSSGAGLVEPADGGLHVIYYGRDRMALASQLLLLDPGSYQLGMTVSKGGEGVAALAWTLTCLPSKRAILTLDLAKVAAAPRTGHRFEVPSTGCGAQQLALRGTGGEEGRTVDLTLTRLSLTGGADR